MMLNQCDDPTESPIIHYEAEMIREATQEQLDTWERWTDAAFEKLQAEYSTRKLREYGGKKKWIRDRNREIGRRMNKAKEEREDSPCVDPRTLAVEAGNKRMSEAGRRGGHRRHSKTGRRMCTLIDK